MNPKDYRSARDIVTGEVPVFSKSQKTEATCIVARREMIVTYAKTAFAILLSSAIGLMPVFYAWGKHWALSALSVAWLVWVAFETASMMIDAIAARRYWTNVLFHSMLNKEGEE